MQPLPVSVDLLQDLGPVQTDPRLLPEGEHLPQRHAEHPRVGRVAELPRLEALGRAPREGNFLPLRHHVAIILLGQSSHQTKVADFHSVNGGHEDISAGQIPVDEPLQLEVRHSPRYLNGKVPDPADADVAALLVHPVHQGAQGRQLHDHHHGLTQHDPVQADQVLVVEGVHGGALLHEVLEGPGLGEGVLLQNLGGHGQDAAARRAPLAAAHHAEGAVP